MKSGISFSIITVIRKDSFSVLRIRSKEDCTGPFSDSGESTKGAERELDL